MPVVQVIRKVVLRFPPDLPSDTIWWPASATERVAVSPRSPIGYNSREQVRPRSQLRFPPDLPSDTIDEARQASLSQVAVSPRSPIGYNPPQWRPSRQWLRFPPDLPSDTMSGPRWLGLAPVAVSPRSPIGYNSARYYQMDAPVAVSPRSPIGYNEHGKPDTMRAGCGFPPISHRIQWSQERSLGLCVAVSPRSPIGYNRGSSPSTPSWGCGFPPISHRIQSNREAKRRIVRLRFPPDLPSDTIHPEQVRRDPCVAVSPRSPIGYNFYHMLTLT